MIVTVNVTAEHIANGRQCANDACPIALALIELFPLIDVISVGGVGVEFRMYDSIHLTYVYFPSQAVDFIQWFDRIIAEPNRDKHIQPFSFELEFTDADYHTLTTPVCDEPVADGRY